MTARSAVDVVILTRFNLPSAGAESTVRTRPGWLEQRVSLFERYCLPSMRQQSDPDHAWIVFFDPASPAWLRTRIDEWTATSRMRAVFRPEVAPADLVDELRTAVDGARGHLVTVNLDNDDALARDFVARVRAVPPADVATAIYLTRGLIGTPERLYLRTDRVNAFCAVAEPWTAPRTCWADWHNRLGRSMPVLRLSGAPAWLQMVHGTNVSNRVHGRLVAPKPYRGLFPGALDDRENPEDVAIALDRLVASPSRILRDTARGAVKHAMLALLGPEGLTAAKARLARAGRTS